MSVKQDVDFGVMCEDIASNFARPSVQYRPTLTADGTSWSALYGPDLQSGVAGFGDTPDEAMRNFDIAWHNDKTPAAMLRDAKS